MKKKSFCHFILSSIIILLVGYKILPHVTPTVTIINKTEKSIYTTSMQWLETNTEPTPDEVDQLKYSWEIKPQGEHIFPVYFSNLISSKLVRMSPDWRIAARANYAAGGGHGFYLDRHKGTCIIKIEIYDDKYKIIPEDKFYCYKKMVPMGGRMRIHTEEKTIFNYYGPNTDKIKEQVIRLN